MLALRTGKDFLPVLAILTDPLWVPDGRAGPVWHHDLDHDQTLPATVVRHVQDTSKAES